MKNFTKFITLFLTVILTPVINGFVFSKLWLWLIVPTFQLQPLRIIEAIGIIFLINFLFLKKDEGQKANNEDFWKTFAENTIFYVLMAGVTLLFGWVITLFF